MSDRKDYYYRQKVTESELDAGFDDLEVADRKLFSDLEIEGIVAGLVVSEHTPNNLTVDVTSGVAYDEDGQRIEIPASQNLDVSVDYLAASTAVASPGNSKKLIITAKFDRALSDPRTDGNGATVYHVRDESFALRVHQGAEAASPSDPTIPSDEVPLARVTLAFGTTVVTNSEISITAPAREYMFTYTTSSLVSEFMTLDAALKGLQDHIESVIAGTVSLSAGVVSYAGGGTWHDGTTNPATDVEAQLDKIIADLSGETTGLGGDGGGDMIGINAITDSPDSLTAGSVYGQIADLLSYVNLRGRLTATQTWTGTNTFNGASATAPAFKNTLASAYPLLFESNSGTEKARIYLNGTHITLTYNASYNAGTWSKDTASLDAYMWEFKTNAQLQYSYDDVNHTTITWLGTKQVAYYSPQRRPYTSGGTAGGTFFTTNDLTEKRVQASAADIKVSIGPVLQGDIIRITASYVVRFTSGTPAPIVGASVYFDSAEHSVSGSRRQVVVDGIDVTIVAEYPMPSDETTAEVALLIQNSAAGTTELEGEYHLSAEVIRG